MTLPADIAERLRAHAGFVENGGCADHGMTDEPWLLREAADEIDRLTGTLARPTLNLDLIEVVAMGLCAKTAIKNGGAGHGCWWELGAEAKDGFRDIAGSLIASQPPPAAPVEPVLSGLQEDLILMGFHNEPAATVETENDHNCECSVCAERYAQLRCSAGSEPVEFINRRLADLAEANSLYGKDQRLGAPDKIARNNREISWLKELRSIILTEPQPVAVPERYVVQSEQVRGESRSYWIEPRPVSLHGKPAVIEDFGTNRRKAEKRCAELNAALSLSRPKRG